jgi:hypothetical protein
MKTATSRAKWSPTRPKAGATSAAPTPWWQRRSSPVSYEEAGMLKFIEIDGKRHAWRDIVRLRRQQTATAREKQQPTLFKVD